MFNQPFDTTPCAGHVIKDIISALSRALAMNELEQAKTAKGATVDGVFTVPSYVKAVAPFFHPIAFEYNKKPVVVIDTRAYLKTAQTGESRIVVPNEYNFLLTRAILTRVWMSGQQADFLQIADFPARIFTRWIPEAIVRRLGLDPMHQASLVALSGLFFFSQFGLPMETVAVAQRIARLTRVPFDMVHNTIDGLDMENVTSVTFTEWVRERIVTPRTEPFNPGLFYASIGSAWFGAAGREVAGVAAEYPPYLFAMIYAGLLERSYRNTPLNKIVEQVDRQGMGKQYLLQVASFISELTHE